MNSLAHACVALVGTAASACASPTDRVIIAAMKLSEQPNYSWFSTIDDTSGAFEIEGRTAPPGVTWVRMPMVSSIGRRLGREADTQLEAIFHGRAAGVFRVGQEWKALAELSPPRPRERNGGRPGPMVRGSAAGSFGIPGGQSVGAAAPFLEDRRRMPRFGDLQLGVTHPHEELAIVVSSFASMECRDDVVTGSLTEVGATLLLIRAEHADVEPVTSAGTFRLWLKDGVVIKYQLRLEGTVLVGRWKQVSVKTNTTTVLKDIGTTIVPLPAEAREKLAALR